MPRIVTLPSLALAALLAASAAAAQGSGQVPGDGPGLTAPLALDSDAAAAAAFAAQVEAAKNAAPMGPPALRATAVVASPYVRLSDIFDNVPQDKDAVVAPAPAPGAQAAYTVDWLESTARSKGLDWRPASRYDTVTVVRDSQLVGRTEITEALRPYLADQGMPLQAEIVLNTRDNLIPVAAGAATSVGVLEATYDPAGQRFTAVVEVPAGAPGAARQYIAGRVHLTTAVPVLVASMRQGDRITARDIDWVTVRVDQLKRDTITDPEQLIGRTPRRFVQAGTPVQGIEIDKPRLISKGATVTMIYHTPYMQLTAQGRALEHGAQGDQVRIQNMQSNQTVTGIVRDENLVTVQIGPGLAVR